jgi:hypothetical protein
MQVGCEIRTTITGPNIEEDEVALDFVLFQDSGDCANLDSAFQEAA